MDKKMLGVCLVAAVIATGTLGGVVASEVADRSLLAANAQVDTSSSTYGNVRFWISSDPNNSLGDSFFPKIWFHGYQNIDFATDVNCTFTVINESENNRKYWYIDVPYVEGLENATGTVQIFNSNGNYDKDSGSFTVSEFLNKIVFIWEDWSKASIGGCSSTNVNVAALALAGLYTCSGSEINGYNAIETLSETWIWNDYDARESGGSANWKTSGRLSDVYCQDYADGADWKDSATPRNTNVNAQSKLDALVALHEASAF